MSRLSSSKTARNTSTANRILIYGHESLWRNRREYVVSLHRPIL